MRSCERAGVREREREQEASSSLEDIVLKRKGGQTKSDVL